MNLRTSVVEQLSSRGPLKKLKYRVPKYLGHPEQVHDATTMAPKTPNVPIKQPKKTTALVPVVADRPGTQDFSTPKATGD